jgi:YHS domain-containing protein
MTMDAEGMPLVRTYDVVCGMEVDPEASVTAEHEGKTYYFCCNGCRGAFLRSPAYHLGVWDEDHPGVDPSPPLG